MGAGMLKGVAKPPRSAYLAYGGRLGDVAGAIQVLGSFPYHAIISRHWDQFFGKPLSSHDGRWDAVFEEHPEFFRVEPKGEVALRWRFASERTYDPATNIDLHARAARHEAHTGAKGQASSQAAQRRSSYGANERCH